MFKGMKSNGFDIEGSHIKPTTVLKHKRRAVSLFKYGLDYIFQCLVNHTNHYRINVFKLLSYT